LPSISLEQPLQQQSKLAPTRRSKALSQPGLVRGVDFHGAPQDAAPLRRQQLSFDPPIPPRTDALGEAA
jgi:hypothetical protein